MIALDVESSQESRSIKNKCKMLHECYNILNFQNKIFIPKVGYAIIVSTQHLTAKKCIGTRRADQQRLTDRSLPSTAASLVGKIT